MSQAPERTKQEIEEQKEWREFLMQQDRELADSVAMANLLVSLPFDSSHAYGLIKQHQDKVVAAAEKEEKK